MSILAWIIVGLLAGLIANLVFPGPSRGGWMGAMLLGIAGALIGGFLSALLTGYDMTTGINMMTILVSVVGALVLLFAYNGLRGSRSMH